ncbi:MAG: N-acetylglucosaminidase [Coriobacteriales bacterium]
MNTTSPLPSSSRRLAALIALALAVVLAALWPVTSMNTARAASGDMIYGAVTSSLKLYSSPSATSSVVATLPQGFTFQAVETSGGWYAASYNSTTVYFSDLSGVSLYAPTSTDVMHGAVVGGDMDVYAAPSTSSKVVTTLSWGKTIQFVSFNSDFYMARLSDGTLCFIPVGRVSLYDPSTTQTVTMYASTGGASAYVAPDLDSSVVVTFYEGTELSFADFNDTWYMARYQGRLVFVPKSQLATQKIDNGMTVTYRYYDISLSDLVSVENSGTWIIASGGSWVSASAAQLRAYLNPANYPVGTAGMYQYLLLDRTSGLTAGQLDSILSGEGVLEGLGQAFYDACNEYGVNEVYLIAHSELETGHGTSTLAKGVWFDEASDKVVSTDPSTKPSRYPDAVLVYNMFGIGAYDSDPLNGGARRAYQEGWTTPALAVEGGAEFISRTYLSAGSTTLSGQNTLYKMLFHPEQAAVSNEKPWHEYATDVGWAAKQAAIMARIYSGLDGYRLTFEVPTYAGD